MSSFNLADLFESVADTVPEQMALVAGQARLTYRELDERCNRLAHHLLDIGVKADDHIGILAFNRAEWIESMLAAYKIRAVPININFRYVEEELFYIFDNADIVALVYERSFTPRLNTISGRLPLLKHYIVLEDNTPTSVSLSRENAYEPALNQSRPNRDFEVRSSDDTYMLYTGGTTGMPKGTVWRHEDIFFGAMQGGNAGGDPISTPQQLVDNVKNGMPLVTVCPAPMMHGGGMWTSMINFFSGGKFVLYCEPHFNAEKILSLAENEKALTLMLVGDAMARPIVEALERHVYDLSNLFVISSGGAILSKAIKNKLKELLPDRLILDSFGASETGHNGSVQDLTEDAAGPRFTLDPHTRILDDNLDPIEAGSNAVGRLARCGHIPQGYYKDELKTAETFQVDRRGARWVIPGDYAKVLEDGSAELLGRGSGCINSGGEKIFPEEVEAVLKGHPAVFDVVVVGVPCERFTNKVCAIVQAREASTPSLDELTDYCKERIARYKVPRELILVESIQRTPAGKPDYRAAKSLAVEKLDQIPEIR